MVDAMSHGYRHPLDVDLADFAGDLVDTMQRETLEDHLSGCLLCRISCAVCVMHSARSGRNDQLPRSQPATVKESTLGLQWRHQGSRSQLSARTGQRLASSGPLEKRSDSSFSSFAKRTGGFLLRR